MTSTYTLSAASHGGHAGGHIRRDLPMLAPLVGQAQLNRLRRRQSLPTSADGSLYIVQSGLIAAESTAVASHRTIVELFYPGDIICPVTAEMKQAPAYLAMTASEVWRFGPDSTATKNGGDQALADYILHRLNAQRERMQLHVTMLAGLTSEERVAGLLLKAAYRLGSPSGMGVSFEMPLSRNEVAAYLSLNADTLSRIMSRLVRDNVLARTSRARMTVRNMEALKALCPLSNAVEALYANP